MIEFGELNESTKDSNISYAVRHNSMQIAHLSLQKIGSLDKNFFFFFCFKFLLISQFSSQRHREDYILFGIELPVKIQKCFLNFVNCVEKYTENAIFSVYFKTENVAFVTS